MQVPLGSRLGRGLDLARVPGRHAYSGRAGGGRTSDSWISMGPTRPPRSCIVPMYRRRKSPALSSYISSSTHSSIRIGSWNETAWSTLGPPRDRTGKTIGPFVRPRWRRKLVTLIDDSSSVHQVVDRHYGWSPREHGGEVAPVVDEIKSSRSWSSNGERSKMSDLARVCTFALRPHAGRASHRCRCTPNQFDRVGHRSCRDADTRTSDRQPTVEKYG